MKEKLFIFAVTIFIVLFGFSTNISAAEVDPLAIESKEVPSESFLSSNKRSIGASTDVQVMSSPSRTLTRQTYSLHGWGDPFLPGEDGWEIGQTGNVGYPIGDVSLPILFSMLIIYFIYRGVSSKRKTTF